MQVYRRMDIGTAKPSTELRRRLPHHLIDIVEPSSQFNAGQFVKAAEELVTQIRARGKVPLLSGGTAFYITSFLYGMPESPAADHAVRRKLLAMAREQGREALYALLKERDPLAAARIQPNDAYRITRALEVLEATGESLFSFRWPRALRKDFRFLVIGLQRDREELYGRIDQRVEQMFADGLLDEVKGLVGLGYGPTDPGMRGIGYRELLSMRSGCQTLSGVRDQIKRNSRRYAKRQLTFFRTVPGVRWIHPSEGGAIRGLLEQFLCGSPARA